LRNELIARDEGLHAELGALLYNHLDNKLSKERIHEIFKEAVEIETQFITESIPCDLVGMNSKLMAKYIKFISNHWMSQLTTKTGRKCSKLYKGIENPFSFMEMSGLDGKTNFFEQRVTEYRKSNTVEKNPETFNNLNDDF
jgi:ribonucleotide reductase beta subunit family protein with ferritin-like domain